MPLDNFFSDLAARAVRGDLRMSDWPALLLTGSAVVAVSLAWVRRNREAPVRCQHAMCSGEFPRRVMRQVALNETTVQWWCPIHKIPEVEKKP